MNKKDLVKKDIRKVKKLLLKSMQIQYLKRSTGALTAQAQLDDDQICQIRKYGISPDSGQGETRIQSSPPPRAAGWKGPGHTDGAGVLTGFACVRSWCSCNALGQAPDGQAVGRGQGVG